MPRTPEVPTILRQAVKILHTLPANYRCRQTLKGTERYVTDELAAREERILRSGERALARERVIYDGLGGARP